MGTKSKVLFLTDSVSLPGKRANKTYVAIEDTYLYRLKKELDNYDIIALALGGATIRDLRNQLNYYASIQPDLVFLQCGIVDCAPRGFGKLELEIFKKLKIFRFTKPIVKFLRKYRGHRYTSKKAFKRNLIELQLKLKPKKFYALSILPSNEIYEVKAPGITKNIADYNKILKDNTNFIDLSDIPRDGILPDHHHINEIGHNFIYDRICELLNCE